MLIVEAIPRESKEVTRRKEIGNRRKQTKTTTHKKTTHTPKSFLKITEENRKRIKKFT